MLPCVQQFKTVQQVRQLSFPRQIRRTKQTPANPLFSHQLPNHHHKSPISPPMMIRMEILQVLRPSLFIIHQRRNVVPRSAENISHQCRPNLRLVSRITQGRKQNAHLFRLSGSKNAHITSHHPGNTPSPESTQYQSRLPMRAHNDRNITGCNLLRLHQKTFNLIGHGRRRQSSGIINRQHAAFFSLRIHEPELQRSHASLFSRYALLSTSSFQGMIHDLLIEKRVSHLIKQDVEGLEQPRSRTPVFSDGKTPLLLCLPSRLHIGKNISTPETVDRLLGITYKKKRGIRSGIDPSENFILYRIGILKLINQCRTILFPKQGSKHLSPALSRKRTIKIFKKVIKKAYIFRLLAKRQVLPVKVSQFSLQGKKTLLYSAKQHFTVVKKREIRRQAF